MLPSRAIQVGDKKTNPEKRQNFVHARKKMYSYGIALAKKIVAEGLQQEKRELMFSYSESHVSPLTKTRWTTLSIYK